MTDVFDFLHSVRNVNRWIPDGLLRVWLRQYEDERSFWG